MNIHSDLYLLQFLEIEPDMEDSRRMAYQMFLKKAKKPYPATYPTMRRWFGLDGVSVPGREQAYKIAYSLEMSLEELSSFLTRGLEEVGIQYNDYKEVILAYGLQNSLSYQEALVMIDSFEGQFESVTSLVRTHNTNQMMNQFEVNKGLPRREFVQWMVQNGSHFKGYSLTVLDYLKKYKDIIIGYIHRDARERLDTLLRETNFELWQTGRRKPFRTKYEAVGKYIKHCRRQKNPGVSDDLLAVINELNNLSRPENSFNTRILSEVYDFDGVRNGGVMMSEKHLSDLLNLPIQKEREIKAGIAENALKSIPGKNPCPRWIADFIAEYTLGRIKPVSVSQAKKWIAGFRKEHHRRCRLIQRRDLLPMILYVAQRRYTDGLNRRGEYQQEAAKTYFVEIANATFAACGMEKINEQYPFDAMVLSCFQPEEMYSLYEVAESAASRCYIDGQQFFI